MKKAIEWLLLESGITKYKISKETGISQTVLSKYTTKESDIGNMSLNNAEKLYLYFKKTFENTEIKCEHGYTGYIFDEKVCLLCGKTLKTENVYNK